MCQILQQKNLTDCPDIVRNHGAPRRETPGITAWENGFRRSGVSLPVWKVVGRRKAPSVSVKRIVVEIDPCSDRDRLRVA
jgi:hypothetical protein